jgi:hypothetical protein
VKPYKLFLFFVFYVIISDISIFDASAQIPTYIVQTLNIDSIYQHTEMPVIFANEIFVFPQKHFKNNREKKRYNKLKRNFIKVYPFALLIEEELQKINAVTVKLPSEEARKAYIKQKDKELKEQFKEPLMKLTMSQGVLLVKLVDRQTGSTAYALIDELKGSLRAFFWQGIARLFGNDLKAEYDAESTDKEIEQLVIQWEHGCL